MSPVQSLPGLVSAPVMHTFFFYDLETSGRDPRWHRILQFAGIRTNADLEPVGEPVSIDVRLDPEVIPEPEACLITGLTPQRVAHGIDESALFQRIAAEFGRPRTCVAGFNNLRFDDEFVRYGFWRNLRDPYAREWQGGNSRWDVIDLARMAAALRPEGMVWPRVDDRISFRLEDLARANDIAQERAHDATSDVLATLGLAQALRRAQPKLFDYHLSLRSKQQVATIVGRPLRQALLHVSARHAAASQRVALVTPVATHPVNRNAVILADLGANLAPLAELDAQALAAALFKPAAERNGAPPIPLHEIALNKLPAVAPLGVLQDADSERLGLDVEAALERLAWLREVPGLERRVRDAYGIRQRPGVADVDGALYDGFLPDADRRTLNELAGAKVADLMQPPPLQDERAQELLFRYLARRHPDALDADGRARWQAHLSDRLLHGRDGMADLDTARARLRSLAGEGADAAILSELEAWLDHCAAQLGAVDGAEA
ncbi:MAG: exodeoxyribonuclease I [Gammaproteobacteria bacterium]|nr:MAG: exodeoxyribonuclease I [Gammaproteobacteria bacterium]